MTSDPRHGFNNLAYATTADSITASATSILLASPGASVFLAGWESGRNLYLTLVDAADNIEVVKVTNINGDTLTVERGQDGTTARAWSRGAVICQRAPAADLGNFLQKGAFLTDTVNPNGIYSVSYPGQKYYQNGGTDCTKRWFIGKSGTTWDVLAGSGECFGEFTHQNRVATTRVLESYLHSIAQNGSLLIASGEYGDICSLDAGVTFTAANDGVHRSADIEIAFGNNTWVRAGSYMINQSSVDDGNTWTTFNWANSYNDNVNRVKYLNGQFIMLGNDQVIQTSTDGINWTETHKVTSHIPFMDIDYHNGTYVICAYDWDSNIFHIYSTTDLSSLTDISTGLDNSYYAITIAYGANKWVICCVDPYGGAQKAIYSSDLSTWNEVSFGSTGAGFGALVYDNSLFVLPMTRGATSGAHVKTSTDGINWTDRTITKLTGHTDVGLYSVIWTGSMFVAVGEMYLGSGNTGQAIVKSDDGIIWSEVNAPYAKYGTTYYAAISSPTGIMCAGSHVPVPGPDNGVTYSIEGVTPSELAAYDIDTSAHGLTAYALVNTTTKYLCAVSSTLTDDYTYDIYESTDCRNWTSTGKGAFGISDMDIDPSGTGLLIAVISEGGIWKNDKNLSGAGESQSITGFSGQCVAFGNGTWVLGGDNGKIFTSTDGSTWTERTPAGSYAGSFYSVAYGNGQFVMVGTGGEIQYSSDGGITWYHANAADSYSSAFCSVEYLTSGGVSFFIAVGGYGEIQTSSDGHTWTHHDADNNYIYSFRASVSTPYYFIVLGEHGEIQAASSS